MSRQVTHQPYRVTPSAATWSAKSLGRLIKARTIVFPGGGDTMAERGDRAGGAKWWRGHHRLASRWFGVSGGGGGEELRWHLRL
jgi:hypothetical protein